MDTDGRFGWIGPFRARPLPAVLGALFLSFCLGARVGWRPDLPALLVLALLGPLLCHIDLSLRRLPNLLTLSAFVLTSGLLGIASLSLGAGRLVHGLIGMAAMFAFYGILWAIAPRQIGLGDVKLSPSLGLVLGWLGLKAFVLGLLAIHGVGLAVAGVLLLTGRASLRDEVAFGPMMIAGTLVAVLAYA